MNGKTKEKIAAAREKSYLGLSWVLEKVAGNHSPRVARFRVFVFGAGLVLAVVWGVPLLFSVIF